MVPGLQHRTAPLTTTNQLFLSGLILVIFVLCVPQTERGVRGQQPLRVAPGCRADSQPDPTAPPGQAV